MEEAEKCAERGLENLDAERIEKWESVKSRFLAVRDYNEGTGKDGPHKTFDYKNEVGEILGERPNVRPCIGSSKSRLNNISAAATSATTATGSASVSTSSIQSCDISDEESGSEEPPKKIATPTTPASARPRRRQPRSSQKVEVLSAVDKILADRKERAAEKREMHREEMDLLKCFVNRLSDK